MKNEPNMKTAEEYIKGCEHDGSYIPVNEVKRMLNECIKDATECSITPERIKDVLKKYTQLVRVRKSGEAVMGVSAEDYQHVIAELSQPKDEPLTDEEIIIYFNNHYKRFSNESHGFPAVPVMTRSEVIECVKWALTKKGE